MLIYLLKSAACLAILLLFYKLFLERESMHVFKRFYLLGSLLFALIVPTIVFSEYVVVEPQVYEAPAQTSSVMVESTPNLPPALEADVTDIAPLLWIVYFIGMFFFGIKFLRNLFQIFRRIRSNPKYKKSSFIQVMLQEKIPPHTFFKYIFLNKSKFESKEIPKEVILHEETHARQKHSLDVVFIELLQVIFWVNPLIYFFKKAIKLNHEFLADSAVLNKNVDAVTYQNTLLSFLSSESAKKYQPSLPNAINYSSIKKRFTIMKSKTSKTSIALRSFLLLPLLAILLLGFTETRLIEVAPKLEMHGEEIISPDEIIQISVNGKGQLLIDKSLVEMEDLDSLIRVLNQDLRREKGAKIARAKIIVNDNSPPNIIADVERVLGKHSIAQIDILRSESETPTPATQEGATEEQVLEYNALAKKYYELPVGNMMAIYRTTNSNGELENELERLDELYGIMSDKQKADAEPYFTLPPMPDSSAPSKLQEGATKEQIREYNTLAQKYNAIEIEEREIPLFELTVLELAYRNMNPTQKKNAQPFPECVVQEGAMKVQVQEYNALAKNYNTMLDEGGNIRIMKSDVDRLEYLHSLMSEEQKADAEPFPDFPEPPPPPTAPSDIEEIEEDMIEMERDMKLLEAEMEKQEMEMVEHTQRIPPPPPPHKVPENRSNYSKELLSALDKYIEEAEMYGSAMIAYRKNGKGSIESLNNKYEEVMSLYDNYLELAVKENLMLPQKPRPPKVLKGEDNMIPPPPEPESPLDHVIRMAKRGSVFYLEDKKISSDRAIEIVKNNDEINIQISGSKSKKPKVRLSKRPIILD